jgi:hypothetical protein
MPGSEDRDAWKSEYIALLDKPTASDVRLPEKSLEKGTRLNFGHSAIL